MILIAVAVPLTSGVAQGTGSIWLDDVFCSGSESRLADCSANPIGVHNCRHSQDAGVRCSSNSLRGGIIFITPRAFRPSRKGGEGWACIHVLLTCSALMFLVHAHS